MKGHAPLEPPSFPKHAFFCSLVSGNADHRRILWCYLIGRIQMGKLLSNSVRECKDSCFCFGFPSFIHPSSILLTRCCEQPVWKQRNSQSQTPISFCLDPRHTFDHSAACVSCDFLYILLTNLYVMSRFSLSLSHTHTRSDAINHVQASVSMLQACSAGLGILFGLLM